MKEVVSYGRTLRAIEEVRSNQGNEGCYFELLAAVQARAGIIEIIRAQGLANTNECQDAFDELIAILADLPPLQSPEILATAWSRFDNMPLFQKKQ